jgi:hypothetical protein
MNNNPASKDIDIKTQKGLDLLKIKAKYYGHYAEFLQVLKLIEEIELLRHDLTGPKDPFYEFNESMKKLGR